MSSETYTIRNKHHASLLALMLLLGAARSVQAQPTDGAQGPAMRGEDSTEARHARELSARARDRFDAGDFAAALVEYTRAYEQLADHPRRFELLNNIAVCHERMFHYDLALQFYQRYLDEGSAASEDRSEVEAVIRGLRELLGKVYVTTNVQVDLWLDNRLIGQAPGLVAVPAGVRVFEARARGYEAKRAEVLVVARGTQTLHMELAQLSSYSGIQPRYFWTGTALTGVALVTGTALALRALAKQRDAEQLHQQDLLTLDEQQKVHNLALSADIAFGAAALFAVGSTVLLFLTDFHGSSPDRQARQPRRMSARATLGPGCLGAALRGTW